MSNQHIDSAVNILKNVKYASVATASGKGVPWNSPLAVAYDNELNIYWFSDKNKVHSGNIRQNNQTFLVIYDSTLPSDDSVGIYIKATSTEVNDLGTIITARKAFGSSTDNLERFMGDTPIRCYKTVPEKVWINDAEYLGDDAWRDFRVELKINELIKKL